MPNSSVPGLKITRVPTRPGKDEEGTNMKDLVGFLDGMEIKRERY